MLRARFQKIFRNVRHRRKQYHSLNHITLSRSAVLHNMRLLQEQHPSMSIIPVLKANAYGHGLNEMAEILNDAHCKLIAVDGYFEAGTIRFTTKHRVLVLGYILPENIPLLDTKRCSFVVQDIACLEAFGRLYRPVRVHLEINTGMNRLGIGSEEIDQYIVALRKYPHIELEGVMSHLADADNETDDTVTHMQVQRFDAAVAQLLHAGFKPSFIHVAQTAGSTKARGMYATALRFGIGLYGLNPLSARDARYAKLAGLWPVLELTSTVIKVLDLRQGDAVSYNGTFVASKPMRLGVLPLGYYEGVPRALSNRGIVTYKGSALPIVGRVCMNHTMIDLKDTDIVVGDQVTVFSADPSAHNAIMHVCDEQGLFAHAVLAGLSSSIRRNIV